MKLNENLYAFLWTNPEYNNCNTYLLMADKKILIDPGHFAVFSHVTDQLDLLGLNINDIDLIILTHFHPDHVEAVERFKGTKAIVALSLAEWEFLRSMLPKSAQVTSLGIRPQVLLVEGDLKVGSIELEVLHAPGHSPGSLCIYWPKYKALFSGDVIFKNGIGRTDIIGGNSEELINTIMRLLDMDVEILLPGHGAPIIGKDNVEANSSLLKGYWLNIL